MKCAIDIGLCVDPYEAISFKLLMLDTAIFYSMMPIWMTVTFTLGHRAERQLDHVQLLYWKVGWNSQNFWNGWSYKGGDCKENLWVWWIWIVSAFALHIVIIGTIPPSLLPFPSHPSPTPPPPTLLKEKSRRKIKHHTKWMCLHFLCPQDYRASIEEDAGREMILSICRGARHPVCAGNLAQCTLTVGSFQHGDLLFGYFLACLVFLLHVHSLWFPNQCIT